MRLSRAKSCLENLNQHFMQQQLFVLIQVVVPRQSLVKALKYSNRAAPLFCMLVHSL
jgi:hypothetical protein